MNDRMVKLIHGDCLEEMKKLQDKSIDLIITDPPYGQTPLEWDKVVSFELLWKEFNRIVKDDSVPILIFGQEPFSTMLRVSNIECFKYDWYWVKERLTNVFQVKRRPGKVVEIISVFFKNQGKYFPQKRKHEGKLVSNKIGETARFSEHLGGLCKKVRPKEYIDDGTRHPTQVLEIVRDNYKNVLHPTQKPVELLEYLIKTYSNENDLVLDCFMGSGTCGVACKNLNRKFIGIEKDENYFNIAKERIEK